MTSDALTEAEPCEDAECAWRAIQPHTHIVVTNGTDKTYLVRHPSEAEQAVAAERERIAPLVEAANAALTDHVYEHGSDFVEHRWPGMAALRAALAEREAHDDQ